LISRHFTRQIWYRIIRLRLPCSRPRPNPIRPQESAGIPAAECDLIAGLVLSDTLNSGQKQRCVTFARVSTTLHPQYYIDISLTKRSVWSVIMNISSCVPYSDVGLAYLQKCRHQPSRPLRRLPQVRFDHTMTILRCGLFWAAALRPAVSVSATSWLRHCDLSDLWQAVERPSNGRRIVVVTTALHFQRSHWC